MGFLRQITVQKGKRQRDGTGKSEAEMKVIKEVGTQSMGAYIYKQQSIVKE